MTRCLGTSVFSRGLLGILPLAGIAALITLASPGLVSGQGCPSEEPPLLNFTGAGQVVCPCFIEGEQAGVVLDAPAAHYPIELLRVGITWASQFGGAPQSLETAIHVYGAGLPSPGSPVFSFFGPVLTDGFINEFDLATQPGDRVLASGPFTVALEFLNANSNNFFAPTVVHDGDGCQAAKNVVLAIPGGWSDACLLGVTGDWVMYAVYRQVCEQTGVGDELIVSSAPAVLMGAEPNPVVTGTEIEFFLEREGQVELNIFDVHGRRVAELANRGFPAGRNKISWRGIGDDGRRLPAGAYIISMTAGNVHSTGKVALIR